MRRTTIIATALLLCGCGGFTLPTELGTEGNRPPELDSSMTRPVEAAPTADASTGEPDGFGLGDDIVTSDADASDAGTEAPAVPPPSTCPATLPTMGDLCSLPESGVLRCEYGDGGPCRTLAYCDGQRWGRGELIAADATASTCL